MEEKEMAKELQDVLLHIRDVDKKMLTPQKLAVLIEVVYKAGFLKETYFRNEIVKLKTIGSNNLEHLGLGKRAYNCLAKAGAGNYGELRYLLVYDRDNCSNYLPSRSFFNIRNLGQATAKEIIHAALRQGIVRFHELEPHCKNSGNSKLWEITLKEITEDER